MRSGLSACAVDGRNGLVYYKLINGKTLDVFSILTA